MPRRLAGIRVGTRKALAVINGKTLAEGESVKIPVKPQPLTIKCLKVEKASVTIQIEGKDQLRILPLR
jgi:hypothetical protein